MTSLPAVPEFSHILVMSSLPNGFAFDLLMVVYNNAQWCNRIAINFSCVWKQVASKDRQKGGREPSF